MSRICGFFIAVGKGIARGIAWLWRRSRVAFIAAVAIVALLALFGIDSIATSGKIYGGIWIGLVDVSGMTADEAESALNEAYVGRLGSKNLYVTIDSETASLVERELASFNSRDDADASETLAQAAGSGVLWVVDASTLGAYLPVEDLVSSAYGTGRQGNLFMAFIERLQAQFSGESIPVGLVFDDDLLESLLSDIESAYGNPTVEAGVDISEGVATATEGHDGYSIDAEAFKTDMNRIFLGSDDDFVPYSANVAYTPAKISYEAANRTAGAINELIKDGASFIYDEHSIEVDRATLGSWVSTSAEAPSAAQGSQSQDGGSSSWVLQPYISVDEVEADAAGLIISQVGAIPADLTVSLYEDSGDVFVHTDTDLTIPYMHDALEALDQVLFSRYRISGTEALEGSPFGIEVSGRQHDGDYGISDAMAYGIVSTFASYTTNYSNNADTQDRVYNVHLAADRLDGSIVASDGQWSFNDTLGDISEESGFRGAGSISAGEFIDSIGGGICQVATTVFNCVFDAGLLVDERHNHTLYMSSYPDGRDAAVAPPTWDLKFTNDTESDILLSASYTASSLTISLIGVDPGRSVEAQVGDWVPGEEYEVRTRVDESIQEGTYAIDQYGQDGMSIRVERIVRNDRGVIVHDDVFESVYEAYDYIILLGPNTDSSAIYEQFKHPDSDVG